MDSNRRIVLKDNEAETKLCALSVDHFWDLKEMIRADRANDVAYELHFESSENGVLIKYVVDPIAECSYVIVSGHNISDACNLIEEKIEHWSAREIFDSWEKAPHDTAQILAILRIGVAAPFEYDEKFAAKLKEGIANHNAEIREATLAAIGYRDWKEFDQVLSYTAEKDPDERCRNRAAIMLEIRNRERAPWL